MEIWRGNSSIHKIPVPCTMTLVAIEPVGGTRPKFDSRLESSTISETRGAAMAITCLAQSSPVPHFRSEYFSHLKTLLETKIFHCFCCLFSLLQIWVWITDSDFHRIHHNLRYQHPGIQVMIEYTWLWLISAQFQLVDPTQHFIHDRSLKVSRKINQDHLFIMSTTGVTRHKLQVSFFLFMFHIIKLTIIVGYWNRGKID